MSISQSKKDLAIMAGVTLVYFVAGTLGLKLALVHPSASAIWPPTGIALAALLVFGTRVWPAIALGAFLVNVTTAGSVATSAGIAAGNTLEAVLGAYLINRFAGGRNVFHRAPDILRFVAYAGMLSTMVSATIGVTSLALGGFAPWAAYRGIWWTWWLGDMSGDLVVAPALLLWSAKPRLHWSHAEAVEAGALVLCLLVIGQMVFGAASKNDPISFLCTPLLIWAAYRFSQAEAASAVLMLSVIASYGTLQGQGPFTRGSMNESLVILQAFLGVMSLTTMILAAVVSERKEAEQALRNARDELERLAISDPLTGLANYRRLLDVLDAEIQRSSRTGRAFALVLLDLDGLKRINDLHGHLVGNRALCRLADVLRVHCRAVDTAARYGGDEFALVLPETEAAAARQVALRISQQLRRDIEDPPLSVSVGQAAYPEVGETIDDLLQAADQELYAGKMFAASRRPPGGIG